MTRKHFRCLGLAVLLGIALGFSGTASGQTVEQAILSALENSPSIDRAEAQRRAARENVRQARAAYLPQVTLNASASSSQRDARLRGGSDFSDTSKPKSASVRAEQSLYTHGLRPIAQRRAVVSVRSSTQELDATQNAIALQVVESIVRIHQARSTLASERELQDLIASQLVAEEERFRLQVGTVTDVVQAEARLAAAAASFAQADAERIQAERQLELLSGLQVSAILPPLDLPDVPVSLDDAILLALEYAPEVSLARSNYEISRLGIAAASRRYGPQIALSVEATTSRTPSPAIDRDDDLRGTISLSVPLFNGGRGSSERRQAYSQSKAAAADIRQVQQDLELRVTAVWLSYVSAEHQIKALETRLAAAEQALEGVIQGRAAGLWTVSDILDAMEQKIAAQQALEEARSAQILSAYELAITCAIYKLPY